MAGVTADDADSHSRPAKFVTKVSYSEGCEQTMTSLLG
jgi:hypothetical protein